MVHVIYNKETTVIYYNKRTRTEYYKSEGAAKAAMTRLHNEDRLNRDEYAIAEVHYFRTNIEKQVTKINLMSRKKFTQPINTPRSCDPSSELYWSM